MAKGVAVVDGTYELIGPKIQGNPERAFEHALVSHRDPSLVLQEMPRTFEGLAHYFGYEGSHMEGIVFQHPDGRMAKIKLRDFGLKRGQWMAA